jgi:hypothetical protein
MVCKLNLRIPPIVIIFLPISLSEIRHNSQNREKQLTNPALKIKWCNQKILEQPLKISLIG